MLLILANDIGKEASFAAVSFSVELFLRKVLPIATNQIADGALEPLCLNKLQYMTPQQ